MDKGTDATETQETTDEMNTLQQGLAKAMVLQWSSKHPDLNLDDIITTATQSTDLYDESLLEKGIDKTLYKQWRFVKFKSKTDRSEGTRKKMKIILPDRNSRPTRESVAQKEGLNIEMKKAPRENMSPIVVDVSFGSEVTQNNLKNNIEVSKEASLNTSDEDSLEKSCPKTEDGIDSYKAQLKEHFNHEKENLSKTVIPESSEMNSIKKETLESEKTEMSNKSKIEQLRIKINKFSKEKQESQAFAKKEDGEERNIVMIASPPVANISDIGTSCMDSSISSSTLVEENHSILKSIEQTMNKDDSTFKESESQNIIQKDEIKVSLLPNKNIVEQKETTKFETKLKKKNEIDEKNENIEKVSAKNIMKKLINESQSKIVEKRIKLIVDESVLDTEISEKEEKGREEKNKIEIERTVVKEGSAKELVYKWKANEIIRSSNNNKTRVEIKEEDGKVVESVPEIKDGVVRAEEIQDVVKVQKGSTKDLLKQWQDKPLNNSVIDKKQIVIFEEDGRVVENEPVMRADVIRSSDFSNDGSVEHGSTKNFLNNWKNIDHNRNFKKDNKIVISEEDGRVAESEPIQLQNVAREDEIVNDSHVVMEGQTKNLLHKWQLENNYESAKEKKESVQVQEGKTKNLLSQWSLKRNEQFKKQKNEIVMKEDDGCVAENTPEERGAEVIKCGEEVPLPKLLGQTKKTRELLMSGSYKKDKRIESVKLWDDSLDVKCVVENEPKQRLDVFREEDTSFDVVATKGYTRNVVGNWGQQTEGKKKEMKLEYAEGPAVFENEPVPSLRYDKQHIKSSGVFENVPVMRDDVVREEDNTPEVIPANVTRNAKKMWFQKEKLATNSPASYKRFEMVRFTPEREMTPPC